MAHPNSLKHISVFSEYPGVKASSLRAYREGEDRRHDFVHAHEFPRDEVTQQVPGTQIGEGHELMGAVGEAGEHAQAQLPTEHDQGDEVLNQEARQHQVPGNSLGTP